MYFSTFPWLKEKNKKPKKAKTKQKKPQTYKTPDQYHYCSFEYKGKNAF